MGNTGSSQKEKARVSGPFEQGRISTDGPPKRAVVVWRRMRNYALATQYT
jgi:hypothetical protein